MDFFHLRETADSPESNIDKKVDIFGESKENFDKLMEDDHLPGEIPYYDEVPGGDQIEKIPHGQDIAKDTHEAEKTNDAVQKVSDSPSQTDAGSGCPIEGHNGHWEGERGNSKWVPDDDHAPTRYNPDQLSWRRIKENYGIDGVEYKDGQPDFSGIAKAEVKIKDFSDDRPSNFAQADEQLALQRGCTPAEVKKWRQEHGYTWHECRDCETLQKVPREVHNNADHSGGVSEYKRKNGGD